MKKIMLILIVTLNIVSLSSCSHKTKLQTLSDLSLSDMIYIPGGTYQMGATVPKLQSGDNTPIHTVTLSSFYMAKDNTRYEEYDLYSELIGQPYLEIDLKQADDFSRKPNIPVDGLRWSQANDYCKFLQEKTGLSYDLPTEAQWEYVARNGGKENWIFPTDNGQQELGKNFPSYEQITSQKGNSWGQLLPLPVGSIPCTPQGICGMAGEVDQWMKDWYSADYYAHSPVNDPQGPATGTEHSVRGAGIGHDSQEYTHNFLRYGIDPNKEWAGFRCVINRDLPLAQLKEKMKS